MNQVITANQQSKQEMNAMYLKQSGATAQKSVIDWFIKGTLPFQILSAIFSAFGFYYDFVLGLGVITAVVLGVLLGGFIEVSKHYSVKGAFSDMEWISRVIMGGVTVVLMVIALTYHYKSLKNYRNVSVKQDLQEQVDFEREQLLTSNKNISSLLENNKELAKVLNNGKGGDDYLATKTMLSNNELVSQLTALNGSSSASNELLKQSERTAKTTSNTLLLLFVTMEFFALFGVIGKFMLNRNTSGNVKSMVTTMDRLNSLESNVIMATETALIDRTMERVNNHINHSPTLPTTGQEKEQKQPQNPQIPLNGMNNYKMPTNAYLMGVANRLDAEDKKTDFIPIINKRNPTVSGTRTVSGNHLKENLSEEKEEYVECEENQEIEEKKEPKEEPKKVLDLMKFSHKEGEFIKLLWDNGEVREGDKLIPKRFVLKQSVKGRETERELVNLYAKLEDMNLVQFKNGYRALADIENIVTTKKGE